MALSSSAKKKSVAAKAKRTKVAVKRKKDNSDKARPPPVVLPTDWPVSSHPPRFSQTDSALRPGSLLRTTCSGSDITLTRSASAVPVIDTRKGKFLVVFPGNFSFGKLAATDMSPPSEPEEDSAPEDEDNNDDETKPTTAAKKPAVATLGRIEGLRTNTPTFRIPFPHLQKSLLFDGKKIPTTSKYLAFSCSTKKHGTVQCKVRTMSCRSLQYVLFGWMAAFDSF